MHATPPVSLNVNTLQRLAHLIYLEHRDERVSTCLNMSGHLHSTRMLLCIAAHNDTQTLSYSSGGRLAGYCCW